MPSKGSPCQHRNPHIKRGIHTVRENQCSSARRRRALEQEAEQRSKRKRKAVEQEEEEEQWRKGLAGIIILGRPPIFIPAAP
jgi:hypothetical protein